MTSVSTGGALIQTFEKKYIQLYTEVDSILLDRKIEHKNDYASLWEFYGYWSRELPTYQSRREYVISIYKDTLKKISLITEKEKATPSTSINSNSFTLSLEDLHEDILLECKDEFEKKKYDDAIFKAFKLIEERVRKKGAYTNSDIGVKLMTKAFNPDKTPFNIAEDKGEIDGWRNLFKGAIGAFKNPHSHRFVGVENPSIAFQLLVFASYLLNYIDNLQLQETKEED